MTRRPGRPPGRSAKGEQTRQHLFDVAIGLFATRGYAATTLRAIASEAGVSPGLLYRYFPSKSAVVMALYDHLSQQFAAQAESIADGGWFTRSHQTLVASLGVLGDHRDTLRAVMPTMLMDVEIGILSREGAESRALVRQQFLNAVSGANDAPEPEAAAVIGRLVDVLQLALILLWLIDRSPQQRATSGVLTMLGSVGPMATAALWLPGVGGTLQAVDSLLDAALYGET